MWSYYGAKTNIIDLYPPPRCGKIIEPFAGTARYSLKYFDRDILLVDKYKVIIDMWMWLQKCSEQDILSLPRTMYANQTIESLKLDCKEAEYLMGFISGYGMERPRKTVSQRRTIDRPNHINQCIIKIARNLHKIHHWKFECKDYNSIENTEATWFIDPPYQHGGHSYVHNNKKINYSDLSLFCKNRNGHIIVCENNKADWMNFTPIASQRTQKYNNIECFWTNKKTSYNDNQMKLL